MGWRKKLSDFVPIFKDQGINHVVAAGKVGVSHQGVTVAMPAGGVLTFAGLGLVDMDVNVFQVTILNNTSAARPGTATAKTKFGFTVTGPTAADVLDITITGRLKGQAS